MVHVGCASGSGVEPRLQPHHIRAPSHTGACTCACVSWFPSPVLFLSRCYLINIRWAVVNLTIYSMTPKCSHTNIYSKIYKTYDITTELREKRTLPEMNAATATRKRVSGCRDFVPPLTKGGDGVFVFLTGNCISLGRSTHRLPSSTRAGRTSR